MQKRRKGIKNKFRSRTDLFKAAKRAKEFTSSLNNGDREKTPVHSIVPYNYNYRPPITTVIYVDSSPVLSPVVTDIGSGLPEGPPWPTGVIVGRGKEPQGAMIYHSQEAMRSPRTHFTVYQRSKLEKMFRQSKYISALKRTSLSQILGISEQAIQDMDKTTKQDFRYGWFSFKPRWLQIVNNSKCFLFLVVVLSTFQSMVVNGMTNINLPALEKRFQLSSKDLGLIAASNDISAILLVSFVSFYGEFGNKIKWLGYGMLITASGCFVFFLPHVLISPYQPVFANSTISSRRVEECIISNGNLTSNNCVSEYESSNRLYLFIFCAAQMLMGAGTTPLYSLAPAYIDENVHPKASPIYLGIFFAAAIAGPGLGFVAGGPILNEVYIHINQPEGANLTARSPQWIGAWWLGYIVAGVVIFINAVLILGFPRELPGSREMREKAIEEGHLPKKDNKLRGRLRDIIPATIQLLKNPVFMFNTMAVTAASLFGGGVGAFIAKFAQLKFGVNPGLAGVTLGAVFLVGASGGIILSGVIVRRFNLKKSCRLSAKYCVIFQLLTLWTVASFMIPGCEQVNLAGVVKPYFNSQLETRSPLAPCNTNCSCSIARINPICGGDKLTYFSPCHAGCSKVMGSKAFNCSCIGSAANGTQAAAVKGYCDRGPGCKNFTYFLVISFALLLAVFLTAIPNKTVVLRCVPDNQRSYSLGFQFIFQRSLGFLPGPVMFGWMFDSLCLFWGESCGKRGRCQIYDIWRLSLGITVFGSALKGMALVFYFLTFWFCKSSYDEEKEPEEDKPKETDALNEELLCPESVL